MSETGFGVSFSHCPRIHHWLLHRDDIHIDNFDMIIMVDYTNPHIYLAFDESLVKMVFTKTEEEYDFNPPADCERVYKAAVSIATVVADYIVRHDPQNLTDDDKLSLKILYGEYSLGLMGDRTGT